MQAEGYINTFHEYVFIAGVCNRQALKILPKTQFLNIKPYRKYEVLLFKSSG